MAESMPHLTLKVAIILVGRLLTFGPAVNEIRRIGEVAIVDWTTLLGCLLFDVAKSRTVKQWPLFFEFVEKIVDVALARTYASTYGTMTQ